MAEIAANVGPWVAIVALLLGIINTVAQWVSRPGRELQQRVDQLGKDTAAAVEELGQNTDDAVKVLEGYLKEHDRRIQRLEDSAPHAPTADDLHELSVGLAKLDTRMDALQRTVDRMDRHLRETDR